MILRISDNGGIISGLLQLFSLGNPYTIHLDLSIVWVRLFNLRFCLKPIRSNALIASLLEIQGNLGLADFSISYKLVIKLGNVSAKENFSR